jgi:hypothetical protein
LKNNFLCKHSGFSLELSVKKNLVLLLIVSVPLFPQEEISCCPLSDPHSSQVKLKHLEYQGIGFNQGYTSLEIFLANSNTSYEPNTFFLDLRGHVFNDGYTALNAGLGWRYLFDSLCNAFGLNAYYDFRKTKHKKYNQVGVGIEYLMPSWEFRANGYFPIGSHYSRFFDLQFDHFEGNQFFVSRKHEFAMTGADAEAGWHFYKEKNFDLFAAIGPYYFKGKLGSAAIGGKIRLEARITRYLTLEIGDSYDQVFHNRFHAEASLNFPFGPKTRVNPSSCCSCDDQIALQQWLHDAPYRNEIIVADTQKKTSAGLDPVTGEPYFILFVDNTSSSNGTFESPFNQLSIAQANANPRNVIYVYPGDGTDAGMNSGIDLSLPNTDNVRLLGSGVSHDFATTIGSVTIPAQTSTLPLITNTLGTVVTLGLGNEVSGFHINGGNPAIKGVWNNVNTTANINRNQLFNVVGTGMELTPTNTQIDMWVYGNEIFNSPGAGGFGIDCGYQLNSSGTVTVQGNTVQFVDGFGIRMLHTNATTITSNVAENFINNVGGEAILINVDGVATIAQSNINDNTIFGRSVMPPFPSDALIHLVTGTNGIHTSSIENNLVEQSLGFTFAGIVVEAAATSSSSETNTSISNNLVRGGSRGIVLHTNNALGASSGSLQAVVTQNFVTKIFGTNLMLGNFGGGIEISSLGSGPITAEITHNIVDSGGLPGFIAAGFLLNATPPGVGMQANIEIDLIRNSFFNCRTGGGIATVAANANARWNVIENTVQRCGSGASTNGVTIGPTGGSWVVHFLRNTVTENDGNDVVLTGGPDSVCIRANDNITDDAILFQFGGATTFNLELPTNNSSGYSLLPPVTIVPAGTCD